MQKNSNLVEQALVMTLIAIVVIAFGFGLCYVVGQLVQHVQVNAGDVIEMDGGVIPAKPGDIILPPLPTDLDKILSITNDPKIGVCVGYIAKNGEPQMIQYSFSYSPPDEITYDKEFVFKFRQPKHRK